MSEIVHLKFPLELARQSATGSDSRKRGYLRLARDRTLCWLGRSGTKAIVTADRNLVTCKKCLRSMHWSGHDN